MTTPAELVSEQFANANTMADTFVAHMTTFTNSLASAIPTAPTVAVTFAPIDAPTTTTIPSAPGSFTTLESEFVWDNGGAIAAATPGALSIADPNITVSDFTETAPVVNYGTAPTLDFGTKPTAPTLDTITVPTAPTLVLPSAPSLLTFTTPTFAGLDLHDTHATALGTQPALTLAAPTSYTYTPGAAYSSALLTALKASLTTRLAGGTGLDPTVEAAIWDRARDREAAIGAANEAEILRASEALGFHLPAAVTAAQLRQAQQDTIDKTSGLSRDVAIKQADLEQDNLKQTIAEILQLEGSLIDYSYKLESIAFESAKALAANAVEIYNAQVGKFREVVAAYTAYAGAYDSLIKGQLAKVEELKANIAIEQAKADINKALVAQYESGIRAVLALVELYRAQIAGAEALVQVENLRVQTFGEQIRAYVAAINGETAKVEAYKATVQGEAAKVDVYRAKAQAFAAKSTAEAEKARVNVAFYTAKYQAKEAEWHGWEARVHGEAERFRALASKSQNILDSYKATLSGVEAKVQQDIRRWEIGIKQYEATANYTISAAKINSEILVSTRQVLLEAAKAGAQIYGQLTASALTRINVGAHVQASAQDSVSYNYTNNTATSPAAVTAV